MKLTYIKGDLFDTKRDVIGHGVNCKGAFGAGVAAQVAKKYPEARQCYLDKYKREGWKPGDVQFVTVADYRVIANMATQEDYGGDGRRYVSYRGIAIAFDELLRFCKQGGWGVAIPKIGAGLAGGDWGVIEPLIVEAVERYSVPVDVYVPK